MKLNKRAVDGLEARERDYFEWDDEMSGFGIRVWPSGTKTYVVRYRQNGRQRFFKIGNHGAVTPDEARKQARIKLGEVAAGEDPQEEKLTRRKSITLAELCDDYLKAADKGLILGKGGRSKKASTLVTDRGRIARHIKPLLGRKLVIDITRADVAGLVRDVIAGKTAVKGKSDKLRGTINVRGGKGTAARTAGLLGGIFSYAVDRGIIETNPTSGVKTPADNVRHRRFSDDELVSLGKVIREADDQYWQTVAFAKLTCLTGWRKSEIEALRWDALDLAHATATLDDSKEGRSLRPLGAPVVKLLSSLDRRGDFVLPTLRQGEHYGGGYAAFKRLCDRAGITDVSPHTARRTVVTLAQERLGIAEAVAGAVVGHRKSFTVTGRNYTSFAAPFLVEAATAISSEIARLAGFADLLPEEPSAAGIAV
ncbi:tyrosine-type recombinase/integrase [Cereibacter azotoformans]|uniref:Phage integrase family protein n=1 Tax=Cereibacter azotoformans TaxID=43057 RepID=A0A2T5JXT4_9RHOB|nr:integrase family protein [Cereibacter azotoformans]MBO4169699.1 integrase family protein [Cereibacter azotoformans]PTR14975.1 phage integrase family protein [Cereibacter azotoformans]